MAADELALCTAPLPLRFTPPCGVNVENAARHAAATVDAEDSVMQVKTTLKAGLGAGISHNG